MKRPQTRGYSLIELLVVLAIFILISVVAVSRIFTGSSEVGGAERVLEEVSARIVERRGDAVRLNGDDRRSRLERFTVAPLPISFDDLTSTASLKTEGTDENYDCRDDFTNARLTCLAIQNGEADWDLSFNDDVLKLPAGWQVVNSGRMLASFSPIAEGIGGRGVVATAIGFDASGKAFAKEIGSSEWVASPSGGVSNELPSSDNAPFWAIYFIVPPTGGIIRGQRSAATAVVAVAVHPSGLIERFRFDNGEWIGFKNRQVK